MRKRIRPFLFVSFFSFCTLLANAQNERVKALFIYNFTKYIEWPAEAKNGPFIIAVLGETPLFDQLVANTSTRKVSMQDIVVKKYTKVSEIEKCHILFISHDKVGFIKEAQSRIKYWFTLLITDSPGMINEGAGLNLTNSNGKQSFEINTQYLDQRRLVYSAALLSLGVKVK